MKGLLSILIPVYNEEKTILTLLKKIYNLHFDIDKEVIIINDGSTDNSEKIIRDFTKNKKNFILINKANCGKGSAIRLGVKKAKGDIITIQDSDLEYNPSDLKFLIRPIVEGKERVVYGSRFLKKHKPLYKSYFLGNKFLTLLTKMIYNVKITDMETCYKVFRSDIITSLILKSNKFDIEPEITAKLLKKRIQIKEIPISYTPRSFEEGKKINFVDGLEAIWCLFKYRFVD